MANTKTVLLMLGLIFVLIVILLLQSISSSKEEVMPGIPSPSIEPISSTVPFISPPPISTSTPSVIIFSITGTSLKDNKLGVVDGFQIFFSDQVAYQDLNYSISPQIRIETSLDSTGKVLRIKPEGIWDFDTEYKLTISKESKSTGGQNLDKDTTITFKTPPYSGI